MITKISAEFESFDLADVAARRIKEAVKDISRIRIFPKNETPKKAGRQVYSDYPANTSFTSDSRIIPFAYSSMSSDTQARYAGIFPLTAFDNDNDINRTGAYIVEAHCKEDFSKDVFSKFISLGGLDISEV